MNKDPRRGQNRSYSLFPQNSTPQYSDPEDFSVNVDIDDDDEEFDGDDADYEVSSASRNKSYPTSI